VVLINFNIMKMEVFQLLFIILQITKNVQQIKTILNLTAYILNQLIVYLV